MPRQPLNEALAETSFLHGVNAPYIEEMQALYEKNPGAVSDEWRLFFQSLNDGSRPGHGSLGWLGLGSPPDTPAEQFASWLPYSAYLADEKLFVNRDSLGFMLELMPQSGADDRMAEVLISL